MTYFLKISNIDVIIFKTFSLFNDCVITEKKPEFVYLEEKIIKSNFFSKSNKINKHFEERILIFETFF